MLGLIVVAVVLVGPLLGAPLAVGLYALSMAAACGVAYTLLYTNRPAPMRSAALEFRSRDWLVASISLALLSSTAIINAQTGVVLLGALSTPEAAGLYSVAQRGALLVAFPLAAVNAAIAPTAARLWSAGDRARLQRLVTLSARGVLVASLPIGLAFIVFGRQLLTFLFGAEFAAADDSLVILSVGQLANAATGSVAVLLVMSGHQRRATVALASGAVLNVIIGIALIPGLAETGAAIAAATSLIVSNLLMAFDARRTMGLDSTALGWIRRTEASA